MDTNKITIDVLVDAPVFDVWLNWTSPGDIMEWNSASEDWHTPWAFNDLREGGRFCYRMEALDKSMGFDFGGTYTKVVENKLIEYVLDDNRKVSVVFTRQNNKTKVVEIFDPENENPIELQREGWLAILNNFKKYTEQEISLIL